MRFSLPSPALVIACLALLLAAGGVSYAATGNAVNIVDPVAAANKAKVDASGKLYVGDGSGPLSVDGTVSGRPAAPASPWSASVNINSGLVALVGPSSLPINVTSLSISTYAPSGSSVGVYLYGAHVPTSYTNCANAASDGLLWRIYDVGDGVTPISFNFPTPLQWKAPANTKACLLAQAGTTYQTAMNAVGFYGG
jgi:hypothetical protein